MDLFVGFDISKLKHDVAIRDEDKKLVTPPFVIDDDREGYSLFIERIELLVKKYQPQHIYIGMEATGDYWKNLYYYLKAQPYPFLISVLNPIQTNAFAKTELRRAKTDAINCKDIALFMLEKKPKPYVDKALIFEIIKDVDRQIYQLKKQQTMLSNKLRIELSKVAPELEKKAKDIKGQRILSLLSQYPTAADIAHTPLQQLHQIRHGVKQWRLPLSFLKKMKKIAHNSIAYKTGPGAGYVVQSLARQLLTLQQEVQLLKHKLIELYHTVKEQDSLLITITGIAHQTAITLEAYIGDVTRFDSAKKIVAYFGMNPIVNQSGKSRRASYLQKKGNPIVRHKLFMATLTMINKKIDPIYHYYTKLIDAGKPKLVAICAAMRKLLTIIYFMLKNNESFNPKKYDPF